MKSISEVLTPEKFYAWVSKHPSAMVIGQTRTSTGCPLAEYLNSEWNPKSIVNKQEVSHGDIGNGIMVTQTPAWARAFIERVDSLPARVVTAQHVLNLLAAIVGIPVPVTEFCPLTTNSHLATIELDAPPAELTNR